jgi:hypothetical protein
MLQQQPAQQLTSLTPDGYQVAVTYQLGIPIAEYKPRLTIRKAIALAVIFVAGIGFCVCAIISPYFLAFMLISVFEFSVLIWVLVDMYRYRDKRAFVCPSGLLYQYQGKSEAIRWDQVEAVWQRVVQRYSYGIKTARTHLYTVRRYDGTTFKFNDQLYNVEALGNTIVRETTRLLQPRYIAAYQAGQTVTFGQISLNQQGVSNGKEQLPWTQIQELKGKGGFISFQQKGSTSLKWTPVQAYKIPNVSTFVALVEYILNNRQR